MHDLIDTSCPIDWSHPLNRGRVAWWLALPASGWRGNSFRDMCRVNDGTFANSPTWRGATRAGSAGAVRAVAGSERVDRVAATRLPVGASAAFTIGFWHRTRNYVSLSQVFGFGTAYGTGGASGLEGTGADDHKNRYVLQFNNHYYFWGSNGDWDTGVSWDADNAGHRILFAGDGTNLRLYRDGLLAAGPFAYPSFSTANGAITAYSRHSGAASSADMDLDDCAIWSRALSASDARQDYTLSRQGYPGVLRRVEPAFTPEAAVVGPSTAYVRRTLYARAGSRNAA